MRACFNASVSNLSENAGKVEDLKRRVVLWSDMTFLAERLRRSKSESSKKLTSNLRKTCFYSTLSLEAATYAHDSSGQTIFNLGENSSFAKGVLSLLGTGHSLCTLGCEQKASAAQQTNNFDQCSEEKL